MLSKSSAIFFGTEMAGESFKNGPLSNIWPSRTKGGLGYYRYKWACKANYEYIAIILLLAFKVQT